MAMHFLLAEKREALCELCRNYGVRRLDAFGSVARGDDFDPNRSDADLLVEFGPDADNLVSFLNFKEALETLLGLPVDLVERQAVVDSRNSIRRRRILSEAELVYAA